MKFAFTKIPEAYYHEASQQGSLYMFGYKAGERDKNACVYLPFGYDENGADRYDFFYLMHGGGGCEFDYLGSPDKPNAMKNIVDNMIENKVIKPTVFVMPTMISRGEDMQGASNHANDFHLELTSYLMPAVESKYRSYAVTADAEGFKKSRYHRAFSGFSMGSVATWGVFAHCLDSFASVMPLSGDSWAIEMRGGSTKSEETASFFDEAVKRSGYKKNEFRVFAATGKFDIAYPNLLPQIETMKKYTDSFIYTDVGFDEGNLTFYCAEDHYHSYQDTYEYIYNGLQYIFD